MLNRAAAALIALLASGTVVAGDATQCVSLRDKQLYNNCDVTISVLWCVIGDGNNCARGLDNESDINPGQSISATPLGHPGASIQVRYAACAGSNTAVAVGMRHKCG